MNDQIKQIAERLRGLRDALDLNVEDAAAKIGIDKAEYEKYESGNSDIPMNFLFQVAQTFGVEISALISGDEAHANAYFVTRKGTGVKVERTKAYKYQALAHGFRNAKAEPFEVTVEPNDNPVYLNTHPGQEFNLILEGTMLLNVAGNEVVLNEGDSIYFDSTKPHGMKALNGKKVRFLAVIM
ncbi:XRE family transcriptional regulator [Paludibacter sp. 221]|uniref:helix-turn-helix domain-containing protein n=1 Tax=Paludibacter sp. 221 TaxID=2302939 RepID=UPI0013D05026|nr:XRE family transcriptional regulator [Paludibacter sp. 221]NDV47533.1 XRE family transcriptional regulator [Paludibacter sp. 221]